MRETPELPPIVCAVDDRYISPLCVFMQSLAVAHPGLPLHVIVMHQGLTDGNCHRVRFHAERLGLRMELRTAPGVDPRYPVSMWVTDATYLRLALPEVVTDYPVALYMDVDLIVLRDLTGLLNTALGGVPLAAVRDPLNPTLGTGFGLPGWQDLGLSASREYFNGGVILFNLPECRRRGIFEASQRFARDRREHILFWDQDALNWAVEDRWLRLDRCWNTLSVSPLSEKFQQWKYTAEDILPFSQLLEDERTAAVLHFAGPVKPWNPEYPAGPARDLYASFAQQVAHNEPLAAGERG
jgi:UDP-D-galactose:(glucosyl)LPS alpha-1,3-D-galactosyltransferase